MDNIFSLNNIYLRCYFLLTFFATTYAAPGVSGSFAGSSSAAFSSASASAHAGSVASAISSANAFTGGAFPSKNPDNTYGLTHQQGISAGSGSYIGLGNINPDSNKFGLSHQVSGTKGSYNNKSQTPCSGCPNNKEKWELDNYDDQSEEKEEEWQEGEQDDCDDGQYRLEHHYHHHKSGVNKKQEEQTMSSIHKIENTNQYNYNQGNNKDGYTTSGTKEQGNLNDRTYNNYGNLGYVGANNQNLNNNYDAYQHNTGALKDSLHPSSSWIDINKKKENENKNLGIPGVLTSTSTIDNKYGNTNKDTVGGITSSQPNLGWTSDTYTGCSNTGSGSGTKCAESTGASNSNQAPVKISQSDLKKTTNHSMSEGNRATTACNNLHGNCGNSIIGEKTQYQSTSVDSTNYMQNGYTDSARKENKPNSYDQQNTGQWKDHANKDNSPSGVVGNVGVGSGCTPGVSSPACLSEPSTLQKNTPIPTQIYGTVGNGPGNVHVGNKPHSYDQQNTGQWKDHADKDNSPSGVVGDVGVGSGCTAGVSSPACSSKPSTLQKNTPIPTQIYGTVGSGPGNVHVGNKPHSYDQQNTGQWKDHANKDNSPSGVVGNVGVGSGCTAGVSSPACSSKPSTLQKNTPIPTQIYGTVGSGPGNVHVGNKPHSYDQQNTGQWKDHADKDNSPSGVVGDVGVGSGCTAGVSSPACSSKPSTLQKNTPIPTQIYGTVGSGPGNVHVGNKPHSYDQQNTGQWKDHANKDNSPSGVVGNVGVGSGCTPGVSSPACLSEPSTLQKNTPIPTQIYGTVGNGPGNVHVGNKPHSYDQQNTGQWKDHADKDNSPSGVVGDVGVGSGCTAGVSSPACSSKPSTLQKNTPIPTQIYGTVGSGPGNVHVGNKPHSYDQQNTGQWKDHANKDNSPSGVVGNVGVGSGCTPGVSSPACLSEPSTLQKNTPIPTQIYGTVGSGPGNVHVGNKPHSYDQQNTGQWKDHANKDNSPSGVVGDVGVGSGCTAGVSSPACSSKPSTLQKNTPIPTQGCTPGMSLSSCSSEIPTVQKNVPTFSQTFGTTGSGASYQNNKNTNQPSGSGNCGTFGSSTCIGSTGYPIGSSQTTVGAIGNGHNIHGQSDSGDKNSYKWNGTNPFLHGGQGNLKPVIHTTSSPIFITNSLDAFDTTSKPIGFGNPFLDGTISNTFGTHHDKHDVEVTPIKSDALDKPIGVGNPFLTNGNGGSKSSTPIYSGANIGSVSSINILPIVTTTIKPIGQNNPFLEVSGGNVVNKYPLGVHPNVAENNKNVLSGSGTSADKDSIHFPKSGVGITSPGTYSNTNRGVKSNNQHNKIFGNVATSNAGSSSTGNIDIDKSTGLNIPSAYNSNNSGHGVSSLTGTAGNNKPSYTLSTSPEFYDYKNISPQTSGNGGATNGNRNSPSNSLINGNNANGQFNPQITNAGAQSFAGAHAGSFASSFSSSQASSSSSSFASSKSGSYTANGDPNILHQLNGNWPFDIARSVSGASSWPSLNAGSHASAFASSSVGGWSGSEPSSVKS
ncbi:probable serine/threonine-protein kinase DDB_G0282963 [Vespa velutina]|uniref:probable serine/threonine-protein kinase DDB_G0282963 n=1 Tax=Vespa velutina TaxID=202808 RepID=UPI001FB3E33B|nr:probable serine/threonine-protein kinase DDB_G0282963 [Vespa velutina]XP_047346433.1 probable serine/threonine-protein kinase DDB_G0282963 [Vespa velutina]